MKVLRWEKRPKIANEFVIKPAPDCDPGGRVTPEIFNPGRNPDFSPTI